MKALLIVSAFGAASLAASANAQAQALGYAIAGPAGTLGPFGGSGVVGHAGAGAELLIGNRAGIGAEYGLLGGEGGAMWIASVNGVLHFAPEARSRGTRPFVTAGYSRLSSGEGVFDAWNVGGGVDIWPRERVGVRVELRDHIRPDRRGTFHHWGLRAGVVFR